MQIDYRKYRRYNIFRRRQLKRKLETISFIIEKRMLIKIINMAMSCLVSKALKELKKNIIS